MMMTKFESIFAASLFSKTSLIIARLSIGPTHAPVA